MGRKTGMSLRLQPRSEATKSDKRPISSGCKDHQFLVALTVRFSTMTQPYVESDPSTNESRRLWSKVSRSLDTYGKVNKLGLH